MTTEIKFRAWDIREGKMVMDALVLSETKQLVTVNAKYFNSPFSFFDGCKWMQYVGLKDKTGKEMYVGDRVTDKYGAEGEIKFGHPFCQGFYVRVDPDPDDESQWYSLTLDCEKELTIIGHIYEGKRS